VTLRTTFFDRVTPKKGESSHKTTLETNMAGKKKLGTLHLPPALWEAYVRQSEGMITPEALILNDLVSAVKHRDRETSNAAPITPVQAQTGQLEVAATASGYKGVYPHGARWKAIFRSQLIGIFDTPLEAAEARLPYLTLRDQGAADQRAEERAELEELIGATVPIPPPVAPPKPLVRGRWPVPPGPQARGGGPARPRPRLQTVPPSEPTPNKPSGEPGS